MFIPFTYLCLCSSPKCVFFVSTAYYKFISLPLYSSHIYLLFNYFLIYYFYALIYPSGHDAFCYPLLLFFVPVYYPLISILVYSALMRLSLFRDGRNNEKKKFSPQTSNERNCVLIISMLSAIVILVHFCIFLFFFFVPTFLPLYLFFFFLFNDGLWLLDFFFFFWVCVVVHL